MPILTEYWPMLVVSGAGLIAWGEVRAKLHRLSKDVDAKVSKDTFEQVDSRLQRIEGQVDRLVDTLVERN